MIEHKRITYKKPDGSTGKRKPPGERNRKHLTEDNVLKLPVKRRAQYMVWDEGTDAARGLHILVSPAGAKTYRSLFYFPGSPKPHSRKLGRVGEISLAEARARCRDDRAKALRSEDPRSDNLALSDSFEACVEAYIADKQTGKNVTALEVKRLVLKACEEWHKRPVATIRPKEIQSLLRNVKNGDADKGVKPKPYLADKLFGHLKTFFEWCAKPGIGYLKASPMLGIDKPWGGAKPRERWFSDDELKKLWACKLEPSEAGFLKLLILTGKRKGALAAMRWGEINEAWDWTPPAGEKNKRVHPLPLPKLAQRILLGLKPKDAKPDDYVFPAAKGGNSGFVRVNARFQHRVQELTGIDDFMPHAVRHTVETKLAELRVPTHLRDLLLDHVPMRGSGAGYDHWEYRQEKLDAMEKWADHVERLVVPEGMTVLR